MSFKIDNKTITLVDKVEMAILDYIKEKKLVPGDSLPNEMELSSELGISRNVLREALSRLRMLGIVQSRTRKGIVIQEPSLLSGFEKVIEPYLLSEKSIVDMMGMRVALEIGLTDFLFTNLDDIKIQELENIVRSQEAMKYSLTVEQETEFHKKIYEISGNQFIVEFQKIIYPVFHFAKVNYESYFEPVNQRLVSEGKIVTHQNLFSFIKNRDMEGYRNAIRIHLQPYVEFIYREK
ncbi:FadR/GntR family transcriptional regulator [Maribellus sediminis]|uniref:FadR/GntR family transcriptional regulator n=1 Tax=Maribellus sediminis TaxID=2696285 RepID=UPI0014313E16|nr:GntR family transcriptional regulator [Maribellus sediminis]